MLSMLIQGKSLPHQLLCAVQVLRAPPTMQRSEIPLLFQQWGAVLSKINSVLADFQNWEHLGKSFSGAQDLGVRGGVFLSLFFSEGVILSIDREFQSLLSGDAIP